MKVELKDWLNSINMTKENLLGDRAEEKEYPAFIINKCMSGQVDTVLFANQLNLNHQLPNKLQYDFYLNSIRKKKRFSPWLRKEKIKDLDAVKSYYGYSNEKAMQALKILNKEQIDHIYKRLDVGGTK